MALGLAFASFTAAGSTIRLTSADVLRDYSIREWRCEHGLPDNRVRAILETRDGYLWIGTDRGLNRLQDGQVAVFTTREGLPHDVINVLLEDDHGRIWIGHDFGIYWIAKRELTEVAATLTDRRWRGAPAANPAFEPPGTSATEALGGGSVGRLVRQAHCCAPSSKSRRIFRASRSLISTCRGTGCDLPVAGLW